MTDPANKLSSQIPSIEREAWGFLLLCTDWVLEHMGESPILTGRSYRMLGFVGAYGKVISTANLFKGARLRITTYEYYKDDPYPFEQDENLDPSTLKICQVVSFWEVTDVIEKGWAIEIIGKDLRGVNLYFFIKRDQLARIELSAPVEYTGVRYADTEAGKGKDFCNAERFL